jgi:tetratricopeptide (TPR) repeat protein
MRAMAIGAMTVLAALAAAEPARAEDQPLGAGCDDAVARGVWELAIDLCSPEMLPADASSATRAHILLGRAKAYEETGDAGRAAADAAEAERLDPGSAADYQATRSASLQAKGDLRQALRAIQDLWDRGENDRALAEADRVIELHPKSAQAYAMRASIYLSRQDNGRAQSDIQNATSLAQNCELKAKKQAYVFTCPE